MQVGVAQYLVLYLRDALYNAVDSLGALQRVALVAEQQVGLELDEVGLVVLDILAEVGGRMLAGERVGIFAVGQQQHLQVHALAEQHVGTAQGGMNACRVAVI